MKEGWEYKKIKDIGSVIGGTTPNTNVAEYWDGTLCWISPAELDGSHYLYDSRKKITEAAVKAKSLKLLPVGTVILSSRAPIGKVVINKVPTYCNQGFKCVVCGKDVYNEFLYWWFWGKTEFLNSLGTGATFKEISKKVVEEITIPVPPLSEQQSIVDYLDSAFAKIDAMKANAEKALNEAKALFQASLKEMLEPKEGWEEKALGEVGTFIRGGNFSKNDFVEDGFPCIHYGQIHTKFGVATYSHLSCVPKSMVKAERCASKGDLVIAITSEDDEGSCKCTAWMADYDAYVGGHAAIFKHTLNPIFVSYYFKAARFQKAKLDYTHGFKVVEISPKDIAKIPISYPSISEQQSIVDTLDSLKSKVDTLQENYDKISQECDALKQAILKQVFE